jgi:hypothetical protein
MPFIAQQAAFDHRCSSLNGSGQPIALRLRGERWENLSNGNREIADMRHRLIGSLLLCLFFGFDVCHEVFG